jgi:hypothetical protein
MLLIALLIFHLDALTWLLWQVSLIRSFASLSVKTPFSTSLLMSASAVGEEAEETDTHEALGQHV